MRDVVGRQERTENPLSQKRHRSAVSTPVILSSVAVRVIADQLREYAAGISPYDTQGVNVTFVA